MYMISLSPIVISSMFFMLFLSWLFVILSYFLIIQVLLFLWVWSLCDSFVPKRLVGLFLCYAIMRRCSTVFLISQGRYPSLRKQHAICAALILHNMKYYLYGYHSITVFIAWIIFLHSSLKVSNLEMAVQQVFQKTTVRYNNQEIQLENSMTYIVSLMI